MKHKLKNTRIAHLADYQIQVRNSGIGNRFDEYKQTLSNTLLSIRLDAPNIIIITGDLFEFAKATTSERELQGWFLRELSLIATVVITNGNHDLIQKNNEIIIEHKSQVQPCEIENVVNLLDIDNIHYLKRSGFYEVDGIKFAVWGHYEKFNRVESDQLSYNPWLLEDAYGKDPMDYIELFHDPIQMCKGFDGKSMKHFEDYKITTSDFKSPLILAGDIHMPDIIRFDTNGYEQIFTYCSSTVMRNFGEGNYYKNGALYQNGNDKHGYNVVEVLDSGIEITFREIKPIVSRHTIKLDDKFDYSSINIDIQPTDVNLVRFEVLDNVNDFFKHQDSVYQYLKDKCSCIIEEPTFDKSVGIDMNDEHTIDDVESIINEDKILELADVYVGKVIDKTSTIAKENKPKAKKMLLDMFSKEFNERVDINNSINVVDVERLTINNCLTFGDNVVVDFDKKGTITRILGSNAVGKTKIFTILGYMFTDLLHADQKPTQHKNNRLELFNYNRPNDVVSNEMVFSINGKKHVLKKTVERSWKRSKNMWDDKDWKTHISGTPTLDIELQTPNGTITDYDEVVSFMSDLISFDEFYTHLFTNQRGLENLLKMRNDHLISEILKIIGLNFFDSLNETYDDVKDKVLDKLVKPQGTIDAMLTENGLKQELLNGLDEKVKEKDDLLESKKELRLSHETELESLNKKIGSAKKVSDVEFDIELKNAELEKRIGDKDVLETKLETQKGLVKDIDVDAINSQIDVIKLDTKRLVNQKATESAKLENFDKDIENVKTEMRNFISSKKSDISEKVNAINVEINTLNQSKTEKNSRLVEIKGIVADNLKMKQDKHNTLLKEARDNYNSEKTVNDEIKSILTKLKNDVSTIESSIGDKNTSKELLTKSDKCNACGEYVAEGVDERLKVLDAEIEQLNTNKKDKGVSFVSISENEYEPSNTKLDALKKVVDDLELVTITHTIKDETNLIDEVKGIAAFMKDVDTKVGEKETEITNIESDTEYLKDEYLVSRKTKIESIDTDKTSLKNSITKIDTLIGENDLMITEKESLIKKRSELMLELVEIKGTIELKQKDIESSNKDLEHLKSDLSIAKESSKLYDDVETIKVKIKTINETVEMIKDSKSKLIIESETAQKIIDENLIKIEQLKQYTLTTSVVKQYKTMLGNKGLQQYIFVKIIDILNTKLSNLLENVSLRLFFDKDTLELRKYDLRSNVISGVQMSSGMETSILGISLLNALKSLNQIRRFNFIMIDEISGQLNSGQGLSYKAYNYQEVFADLLNRIKEDTCVYVVDHVIENLGESNILEVQLTDNGSVINKTVLKDE